MVKALVFTPGALFRLSQCEISSEWFAAFSQPFGMAGLKRVEINKKIYFIEDTLDKDDGPLVVIDLAGSNPVFSMEKYNTYVLDRIITVARAHFTNSVKIPVAWRAYHDKSLLSIYIANRASGLGARINFDMNPNGESSLFVFATTSNEMDLPKIDRDISLYREARSELTEAVLATPTKIEEPTRAGIVLSTRLPQGFMQGSSLDDWYTSKLTVQQLEFVNKPHDGPVRLRGAAGTGKTISLVIKAMRDARAADASKSKVKYGFLTHSLASVDMVSAISENLDQTGLISGNSEYCSVELRTLYDLAHQYLKFDLIDLEPLSLDGREGRRLQSELIGTMLVEMAESPILVAQFEGISPQLKSRWLDSKNQKDPRFISELMNEFASIFDADGVRAGEEKGERYAKGLIHRPNWFIALDSEIDRRFILELHKRYRACLSEMNTLSVDQMIADFNSFLDSNRWDNMRNRVGFDALFVDELHLFSSVERQILHKLIKPAKGEDHRPKRPAIFMAYDLKQSPNDVFISPESGAGLFSSNNGLQNSELVKLEKVFRYTPQIAEFLSDLDASFPAIDIPGDWDAYSGQAQLDSGPVPQLTVYKNERDLFISVLDQAKNLARTIQGGGRRVAVLCPSAETFDRYLPIAEGQYEGAVFSIDNRAPSSELRHAGKRFIFSMPEYVAGLQFDTVFLIHVDAAEAPADGSLGFRRRFISSVYLGSSRAERSLYISACAERGGASDILDMARQRGSLEEVTINKKR
ncbi:hypothetical protein [Achromobacter xylosoxidans]|uniref:hypothetical protein n=1 Tax=Alcaligenes xylosoxydans xylosoxydans TaxID=85698 RepID=UPI0006C4B74A|nr:hypothetical protein [Achromobacter xylosoxidans]CUI98292.1 Uncharacterised protein [Achromobacter xylosoxidans]